MDWLNEMGDSEMLDFKWENMVEEVVLADRVMGKGLHACCMGSDPGTQRQESPNPFSPPPPPPIPLTPLTLGLCTYLL